MLRSQRYAIQPRIRSMADDDGMVLLDIRAGKYYSLNKLGALIWHKVEEGRPASEIASYLRTTFQISVEKAMEDLGLFLADLEQKGLIHGAP